MTRKFKKNIVFLPIICGMVFVVWYLLFKVLIVGGKYEVVFNASQGSKFIQNLFPEENSRLYGDNFSVMTQDWNSFIVPVSRTKFSNVDVELKYQNPQQHPELFAELSVPGKSLGSQALAVYNPIFDSLNGNEWSKIFDGDLVLWQRKFINQNQIYNSVHDFLRQPPSMKQILTYNYPTFNTPSFTSKDDNVPGSEINEKLFGSYIMYTYVNKNQTDKLHLNLIMQDINFDPQLSKQVIIKVQNSEKKQIKQEKFNLLNNNKQFTDQPSGEQQIDLLVENLEQGVYKILIEGTANLATIKISSNTDWIVFAENINFEPKEGMQIFLIDGNYISFTPDSKNALQNIKVDNENLMLAKKGKKYKVTQIQVDLEKPVLIEFSKNGGQISTETNGFIAFSMDNAFIPFNTPTKWTDYFDESQIDLYKFDYILAQYVTAQEKDSWLYAKTAFNLRDYDLNNTNFIIKFYAPDLFNQKKQLYLSDIRVVFKKNPLDASSWRQMLEFNLQQFVNKHRELIGKAKINE